MHIPGDRKREVVLKLSGILGSADGRYRPREHSHGPQRGPSDMCSPRFAGQAKATPSRRGRLLVVRNRDRLLCSLDAHERKNRRSP
jgi:hypothetical protein